MQTLTYAMLVFAGQGNVYVLREHGRLWSSRPAPIMLLASLCDVLLVASLAAGGVLMSPLPITVIGLLAATTIVFTFLGIPVTPVETCKPSFVSTSLPGQVPSSENARGSASPGNAGPQA